LKILSGLGSSSETFSRPSSAEALSKLIATLYPDSCCGSHRLIRCNLRRNIHHDFRRDLRRGIRIRLSSASKSTEVSSE
jgi:hypothetical protein